jgi:hypothetical protein
MVARGGHHLLWLDALEAGEDWAATFCRLQALAARLRDAVQLTGRARWNEALALVRLLTKAEAEVRRQVEEIERRPGWGGGERLTEGFWIALYRIHQVCGCDVPTDVVFPEDEAAALQALKQSPGLAALADVREVLDRQFNEQWKAARAQASARPHPL